MKTTLRLALTVCGLAILTVLVATGQAQDYSYVTRNVTEGMTE